MARQLRRWVWTALAALVALQAFTPVFASAGIAMRCAGASLDSQPCAYAPVSAISPDRLSQAAVSSMPCCLSMTVASLAGAVGQAPASGSKVVAVGRCYFSVQIVSAPKPLALAARPFSPAYAAPAVASAQTLSCLPEYAGRGTAELLPRRDLPPPSETALACHGLRAPPLS